MFSEKGQVLIVVVIILAIFVAGILIVGNSVGVDFTHATKNCVEVIYGSGVKEIVCQ